MYSENENKEGKFKEAHKNLSRKDSQKDKNTTADKRGSSQPR